MRMHIDKGEAFPSFSFFLVIGANRDWPHPSKERRSVFPEGRYLPSFPFPREEKDSPG